METTYAITSGCIPTVRVASPRLAQLWKRQSMFRNRKRRKIMILKEYLGILEKLYSPETDDPTAIVQLLAALAGAKLSREGKLPKSCGVGDNLDMDIVNAGILA